jgi:hypothetical protein
MLAAAGEPSALALHVPVVASAGLESAHACMGRAGHARSSLHICIQCNLSFTQCFVRRLSWVLWLTLGYL